MPQDITYKRIVDAVYSRTDQNVPCVHPNELIDILAELLIPEEPVIEGPPEEIGTGLYRMADGEVFGNEPESPQF